MVCYALMFLTAALQCLCSAFPIHMYLNWPWIGQLLVKGLSFYLKMQGFYIVILMNKINFKKWCLLWSGTHQRIPVNVISSCLQPRSVLQKSIAHLWMAIKRAGSRDSTKERSGTFHCYSRTQGETDRTTHFICFWKETKNISTVENLISYLTHHGNAIVRRNNINYTSRVTIFQSYTWHHLPAMCLHSLPHYLIFVPQYTYSRGGGCVKY